MMKRFSGDIWNCQERISLQPDWSFETCMVEKVVLSSLKYCKWPDGADDFAKILGD